MSSPLGPTRRRSHDSRPPSSPPIGARMPAGPRRLYPERSQGTQTAHRYHRRAAISTRGGPLISPGTNHAHRGTPLRDLDDGQDPGREQKLIPPQQRLSSGASPGPRDRHDSPKRLGATVMTRVWCLASPHLAHGMSYRCSSCGPRTESIAGVALASLPPYTISIRPSALLPCCCRRDQIDERRRIQGSGICCGSVVPPVVLGTLT